MSDEAKGEAQPKVARMAAMELNPLIADEMMTTLHGCVRALEAVSVVLHGHDEADEVKNAVWTLDAACRALGYELEEDGEAK